MWTGWYQLGAMHLKFIEQAHPKVSNGLDGSVLGLVLSDVLFFNIA